MFSSIRHIRATRRFRPGPWLTLGAAALVALTVSLGNWQTRRAEEKSALERAYASRMADPAVALDGSAVDPQDIRFRRVSVRGEYRSAGTLLLDNQVLHGTAGYRVITPLKIAGSDRQVLVDRGWVTAGSSRAVLPRVDTPGGILVVQGVAVVPPRVLRLGPDATAGPVRQGLDIGLLAGQWGVELLPILIEEVSDAPDGLERVLARPPSGVDMHRAYALQWYSFAALAVIFYVLLGFRRRGTGGAAGRD